MNLRPETRRYSPRCLLVAVLVCLLGGVAAADGPGLAFGPWTFVGGNPAIPRGQYAYTALSLPLTGRLEFELVAVTELSPYPFRTASLGGSLVCSLLGDRYLTQFNMLLDFGFLHSLPTGLHPAAGGSPDLRLLYLRWSPLVIGNPYYGLRDRVFSLGLAYDIDRNAWCALWNIIILQVYR